MNRKRTGIVLEHRCFDHAISRATPENPERLRRLYQELKTPRQQERFVQVPAREASMEEVLAVHSSFYLDQVREHALNPDPHSYDRDTYLMESSLQTARLAAGGCLALADRIMQGELECGFALVRPPGHHAEAGRGMGFCILNNIAITAQYLRRCYGLERILIVDFDIHHCNGTQNIFYETDQVLVWSIHQENIFPHTGQRTEVGREKGMGYTINLPVHEGFGDQEYTYLAGRVLGAVVEQYLPQILLVSAGYDGHEQDSISRTRLTSGWFATMTALLRYLARQYCDSRLLFVLEGGYNPASLYESVLATLDEMARPLGERIGIPPSPRGARILEDHPLHRHWTLS